MVVPVTLPQSLPGVGEPEALAWESVVAELACEPVVRDGQREAVSLALCPDRHESRSLAQGTRGWASIGTPERVIVPVAEITAAATREEAEA